MSTKFNNKKTGRKGKEGTLKFRSKLEAYCFDALRDAGVQFSYETLVIPLIDGFEYEPDSGERIGKSYKLQRKKVSKVTYKPDFVGDSNLGIVETKGYFTPVARLKGKLFKKGLVEHGIDIHLFMPTNRAEIKKTIEIIQDIDDKAPTKKRTNTGVFQDTASV